MVFLGDVAHPFRSIPEWSHVSWPWKTQVGVANLEGPVVTNASSFLHRRVLVNDVSVIDALKGANAKVVSLANNHSADVPGGIAATREVLACHGIHTLGAGRTLTEAMAPVILEDGGFTYVLVAFGWGVIRSRGVRKGREGVAVLEPRLVLQTVEQLRWALPSAAIVVLMHWNYEMEPYPQPAHRQLAMAAIDAGASAIIGHHPHCVGSLEMYRGCPIAYSLGNWWIPWEVFFGGRLTYPPQAALQLALEWTPGHEPVTHWFEYRAEGHRVVHLGTESIHRSVRVRELTPFAEMGHRDYISWFRSHRRKRKALPVYKDFNAARRNQLKDGFVWARGLAVDLLRRVV